jgi:Lantibiotic biosynthesis dehydratase C-term
MQHPDIHLTAPESAWKEHIGELCQRLTHLYQQKKLYIPPQKHQLEIDEYSHITSRLLGSYVHMTNNRLGLSITQEIYLAYLLKRSLEDILLNLQDDAGVRVPQNM